MLSAEATKEIHDKIDLWTMDYARALGKMLQVDPSMVVRAPIRPPVFPSPSLYQIFLFHESRYSCLRSSFSFLCFDAFIHALHSFLCHIHSCVVFTLVLHLLSSIKPNFLSVCIPQWKFYEWGPINWRKGEDVTEPRPDVPDRTGRNRVHGVITMTRPY